MNIIFYFIWIFINPIIFISPFIIISLNSWFSIWVTLELNMMSFIPFIFYFNQNYKEYTIKYFIIQSISSSILILSSMFLIIDNMKNSLFYFFINFMNLSLLMKLGAAPFHHWFINMMSNLSWLNCLILSTWQKISPFILLSYNYNSNLMIYFSIILSMLTGSIFGLNHTSLRLMMSYSSINHISWMLLSILISENLWIMYFIIYMLTNFTIMIIFYYFNIFSINQLYINKFLNNKYFIMMNFFSISGLPPFMGFLMKWYSIISILMYKNFLLILMILLLSIFSFYYYSRLLILLMLIFKINIKLNFLTKMSLFKMNKFMMMLLTFFSNLWMLNLWIM